MMASSTPKQPRACQPHWHRSWSRPAPTTPAPPTNAAPTASPTSSPPQSAPQSFRPCPVATTALQVEVNLATLTGDQPHPARIPGTTGSAVWLTPNAAHRLACDATVRRLLVDPAGIPLDLGREVRVFTPTQRRALATRDRGCRFPGCHRPAVHTDAHHLIPWAQGGQSDLTNGLLLCRHHHRTVHEGGWPSHPTTPERAQTGL